MNEPIYVAQTGECATDTERREWLRARRAEAREQGITHMRVSAHPTQNLLLIEGWSEPPLRTPVETGLPVLDEGEPRFQLVAAPVE
jgi:hypothetical protein